MRKWLAIAFFLLCTSSARAQYTNVTAVVKDAAGTPYANSTYNVSFVVPPGATIQPVFTGTTQIITQTVFAGVLTDGSGNLAITLPDNNQITPAGTQWRFSVCYHGATPCFNTAITITGASQSITAELQAASALITPGFTGGVVAGNLVPSADEVYSLGSSVLRWNASLGTVTTHVLNGERVASGYAGADTGAKITAAVTDIVNNSGGRGSILVDQSGNVSSTITIPASTTITIRGLKMEATQLTWTGAGGGTMFDSTATSDFALNEMTLWGGTPAANTAWVAAGGASQRFFDLSTNLRAFGFAGVTIDLSGADPTKALSDSRIYNLKVGGAGTPGDGGTYCMSVGLQDIEFYSFDCQNATVAGVNFATNATGAFFGGHFSTNPYDIRMGGAGVTFFKTWFENSVSGILTTPFGPVTTLTPLSFYSCMLHTFGAKLIDTTNGTNLAGAVVLVGNRVGVTSSSSEVVLNSLITDKLIRANQGLTVTGAGFTPSVEPSGQRIDTLAAGGVENTWHIHNATVGGLYPDMYCRIVDNGLALPNTNSWIECYDGKVAGTLGSIISQFDQNGNYTATGIVTGGSGLKTGSIAEGSLGTPANGSIRYCSDCDTPPAQGDVCTSAGDKAGATAIRSRGVWKCY